MNEPASPKWAYVGFGLFLGVPANAGVIHYAMKEGWSGWTIVAVTLIVWVPVVRMMWKLWKLR